MTELINARGQMKLSKVIDSISTRLKDDFKNLSAEINHRGAKGSVREQMVVTEFFEKYTPSKIAIGRGEIVSTDGQVSNECDVVFYDRLECPVFFESESYKVFPAETVYGVAEVKSKLDGKELKDAVDKIRKVKLMPKSAFEPQRGAVHNSTALYGRAWNYYPTLGFIFAYDSIDLNTLKDQLIELQKGHPVHTHVDLICVLNKGLILSFDSTTGTVSQSPTEKTTPRAVQSDNPLLITLVLFQELMLNSWMPRFRIRDYLEDTVYGKFI
jgi:uncharacterized protein DUF6602